MILIGWGPWLALGGSALYLGLRYVRALERRNVDRTEIEDLRQRVLALEDGMSGVEGDLKRVIDQQELTTHLLGERSARARRDE